MVAPCLIALALILSVTASSCSSAARQAPTVFETLAKMSKRAEPVLLDLGASSTQQASNVDDLSRSLQNVPKLNLTSTESAIVTRAEQVMAFWDEFSKVVFAADDVALKIPKEAVGLVSVSLTRDADPRVAEYFNELAVRALKSLSCTTAQSLLTTEEANYVAGDTLDFDPGVGITIASVVEYVNRGNQQLKATLTAEGYPVAYYSFAADRFAAAAIDRANTWTTAVNGVLTSPDLAVRRAYIYYIQLCLVPTGSR